MANSATSRTTQTESTSSRKANARKALEHLVASDPEVRKSAIEAAQKAGLSLGEYLNQLIMNAGEAAATTSDTAPTGSPMSSTRRQSASKDKTSTSDSVRSAAKSNQSAYGAARAMMGRLKERVEYVERAMGEDSDAQSSSEQRDSFWTDRIEELTEQIEKSEQYMIGGLMTVEQVLASLAERTRLLEKNKKATNRLALLMENFATLFYTQRDETNARLAAIDSSLDHLNLRVDDIELGHEGNDNEAISNPLVDRLNKVIEQDLQRPEDERRGDQDFSDGDGQEANRSFWGTRDNPTEPLFGRAGATSDLEDNTDLDPDAQVDANDLIDPPAIGQVEIDGIKYSLPISSDDEVDEDNRETVSNTDQTRHSLFDPAHQLAELDSDPRSEQNRDNDSSISSDSALRNFLKRTREKSTFGEELDVTEPEFQPRIIHAKGLFSLIIFFAFLTLLAAGYFLIQDFGGADNNPQNDGRADEQLGLSQGSEGETLYDLAQEETLAFVDSDLAMMQPESPSDLGNRRAETNSQQVTSEAALPPADAATSSLSSTSPAGPVDVDDLLTRGVNLLKGAEGTGDQNEGARLIRQAADLGSPSAQYHMGALFEQGLAVGQDYQQAFDWYKKAAQAGNRKAMHNLAVLYTEGLGVKRDYAIAAEWFSKAADLGLSDSQYNLGVLYSRGLGVNEDQVEAYKWFELLARAGDADARTKAENLALKLDPTSLDLAIDLVNRWEALPMDPKANDERFM